MYNSLNNKNELLSFGNNYYGQLGIGNNDNNINYLDWNFNAR